MPKMDLNQSLVIGEDEMAKTRWDADEIRSARGKSFMLRFLPYLDTPEGDPVESVIGYRSKRLMGSFEEFFNTRAEAQKRLKFLIESGVIENAEIRQEIPGQGMMTRLLYMWPE